MREEFSNLQDDASNQIIDLYVEAKGAEEDMKFLNNALIDFYMKMKESMKITEKAIEKTHKRARELRRSL